MKIAHLATVDIGIKYLLLNQLLFIKSAGHEVHAICKNGPLVPEIEQAGIPVHTVHLERKISPFIDIKALIQIYQLFRREQFDLIHTHTPKASLLGQIAARLARIPHRVHTIHGLYIPLNASGLKKNFWFTIEKTTMKPAHIVLSQNHEDLLTVVNNKLANPQKLIFLGNGIDIHRFNPLLLTNTDRSIVRKELGIPSESIVIGMVGRLVAEKGFFDFFEAAHLVAQQVPHCTFLCVGPPEPDKTDKITQADIQAVQQKINIRFLGMRSDLPQLYAAMNIFVHPSHREGFPRVAMEAAAMSLPMVVTNIRGCREIITHEVNGLIVPPKDPQALADAIIHLIRNPDEAQRFAVAARKKALAEFDEQVVFQRVLNAYDQL